MSDFFATAQTQNQAFRNAMDREPATPGDGGPFEGLGQDTYAGWIARPGVGVNRAMIQAGRFAEDVWRGLTELDDTPAIEGQQRARDTWWEDFFSANETYWRSELERNTIDPATRSDAANLIGGISNTLGSFIAPTLALGPLGGRVANIGGATAAGVSFGRESQVRLESEGVSQDEALTGGLIEGGWMGAMALLPVSVPGRIWQRAASGAALNAGAGVGMRASMNEYLNSIDRPDLAERYPVFDGQAMTIDTVLGGTFGALFGRRPASVRPHMDERAGDEGEALEDGAPDPTPDPEGDAFAPLLPETGEGFLDEARLYGNEEMYQEAYAYALIARDMGAADAENVLALLEEDASPADLDAGRAIANEIAQSYLERAIEPAREAAIVEADTRAERMAFGVPEDPQSARWGRQAMSDMARQAARDEPLNPGPPPEGVAFVPRPEDWESAAIFDDIGREIEDDLRARGLGDAADRMQAMREANPGLFDPDEPLFSMGRSRGKGPEAGPTRNERWDPPEGVHLTERVRKIVEMAVNGASNEWIALEMGAADGLGEGSVNSVRIMLSQAKAKLGGVAPWDAAAPGSLSGVNPRTGDRTASLAEIIALRDKLRAQGFSSRRGMTGVGARSINQTIAARLGLNADTVKSRISQYERAVREGRRAPFGDGDALYSMGPFYSAVERVISNSATARASGSQWWATISKAQGVKREELEWIGLEDFLKAREGQISREDVLAFVRENGVRVEETVLGGDGNLTPEEQTSLLQAIEERDRIDREMVAPFEIDPATNRFRVGEDGQLVERQLEGAQETRNAELQVRRDVLVRDVINPLESKRKGEGRTRWSQYTLPGGENYRELLLRLPTRMSRAQEGIDAFEGRLTEYAQDKFSLTDQEAGDLALNAARGQMDAEQAAMVARDPRAQQLADELREAYTTRKAEHAAGAQTFQSSHFAQANILAHVRFNERTDAQGRRTLFIEELQSDWHQAGRERGYQGDKPFLLTTLDDPNFKMTFESREAATEYAEANRLRAFNVNTQGRVPDAPFKNNAWASLALKRMIRYASENGFEQIAWTRGHHQIDRFNLGREMNRIYFNPETREFTALARGGGAHKESNVTDARLTELLGKEGAKQVLEAPRNRDGEHEIAAGDITIGGEGMRAFYDKIMVNIANDLGKKFGARADEAQVTADKEGWHITPPDQTVSGRWMVKSSDYNSQGLHFDTEAEARAALAEKQKGAQTTVHSLPITPEMREAAMEGQALFSQGGARAFTPVEALKARAAEELGADWGVLERAGFVEVIPDASALPFRIPEGVQALHLRHARKTYLLANAINPDNLRGLILHEIGVHHGMASMLGKRGWGEMLAQVDRMLADKHPAIAEARALAEAGSVKENVREETIAYLVEAHADLPLVQRILSRIRQWLIKTFGTTFGMRLTVDDIRALAVTSLRRVAEEARREAGEVTILAQASAEVAYPIDAYHGTMRPIVGPLRRSGSGALGPGFYVARNPKTTDVFAGTPRGVQKDGQFFIEYGSGANVLPLIVDGRLASKNAWDAALSREAERLRLDEQSSDVQYAAVSRLEQDGFAGVEDVERDFINIFDPARSIRSRISGEPFFSYGKGPDAGRGGAGLRGVRVYHGTTRDFTDFSTGNASNGATQDAGMALFFAENPETARIYSRSSAVDAWSSSARFREIARGVAPDQREQLLALAAKKEVHERLVAQARARLDAIDGAIGGFDSPITPERRAAQKELESLIDNSPISNAEVRAAMRPRVVEADLNLTNPRRVDMRGQEWSEDLYVAEILAAKRAGNDGVVFEGVREPGAPPDNVYAVFDAASVRPLPRAPDGSALPADNAPNGGPADDFPLFSMGSQNRQNVVGAKRDPIENEAFQERLAAVRDTGRGDRANAGDVARRAARVPEQDAVGRGERQAGGVERLPSDAARGNAGRADTAERDVRRQRIAEILSVSGIHLTAKPKIVGQMGDYRLTIDTPFATEMDGLLQAKAGPDGPTWIDFDYIDGSNPKETRKPGVYLRLRRVHNDLKGMHVGRFMTRQLYDWAFRQGLPVYADYSISPEAQRLDASMKRLGYRYEKINDFLIDEDGHMVNMDALPIFVIDEGESLASPYDSAPPPRDDYQIDGPTLRERQQRVDEARERQQAYDDASPAEQALMDDPDKPLFTMGARKVSAREAMDNARLEQETARRVALGAQAAAKCAARHGMGRASYIALNEVTPAVVAASVMGRALGLGMAIPIGITATPILARRAREDADPIGTAKTDAWWAAQEAGMAPPSNLSLVDYPDEVQGQPLAEVLDVDGLGLNEPVRQAGPPPALENPSRTLATDYQQPPAPFDGKPGFAPPENAPPAEETTNARDLIDLFDPVIQSEPQE